jgi:hypothetical protein
MNSQNSISTILPQLLRLYNNNVTAYEKITEAVTTSQQQVTIDFTDGSGNTTKLQVPSFGYLKSEIDRLDQNVKTLVNFNVGGNSSLLLSDGTFRKIILSSLLTEAKDLTSIASVNKFKIKDNYFFDDFLTPLLYVSFDLTGQVPNQTEEALIKRVFLTLDTPQKQNYFNETLKGSTTLDYNTTLTSLDDQGIVYVTDESVESLPPNKNRFYGNFDIVDISSSNVTQVVNSVQSSQTKKLFILNKLTYSDADLTTTDSLTLKIGDSLVVNSTPIDTRYVIKSIDTSTNAVTLELVEGNKGLAIGASVVSIYSTTDDKIEVNLNVGYNEYMLVFIKPVDPNSRIPAVNWSPGTGFYTNDLLYTQSDGSIIPLSTYYKNAVIDFGRYIMSLSIDKLPTSAQALQPNAPELVATDFSVVQINQQITDQTIITNIEDLNKQKNSLSSELKELDSAVTQKRAEIATKNYQNNVERDADRNALFGLVQQRSTKSDLYSSLVKEIDGRVRDNGLTGADPKYRVRGFFPIPEPRVSPETGTQQIVQFLVEYRYLSTTGAANPVKTFDFTDNGVSTTGAYSNWNQIYSAIRSRSYNAATERYEWDSVITQDADTINMNQIDISIQKAEQVEIRIKSISEAGWPANPAMSSYSNSVIIAFPEDINTQNALSDIIKQNQDALAAVKLQDAINAKGIDTHLASSFYSGERYFAHDASVIASGFVASSSQQPIDLFTKLNELQNVIIQLQQQLTGVRAEMQLTFLDENGVETPIARNQKNNLFAGYYTDAVNGLTIKKGAIVTKTFFINIKNSTQTPLELISRIWGSSDRQVVESENPTNGIASSIPASIYSYLDNYNTYTSSDTDYNTVRRYDIVPLLLTNPEVANSSKYGNIDSLSPYQSCQVKGQFIYARYKDIAAEQDFYSYQSPTGTRMDKLDDIENIYTRTTAATTGNSSQFIWGGSFYWDGTSFKPSTDTAYSGSGAATGDVLEVHVEHPVIAAGLDSFKSYYENATYDTGTGAGLGATVPSSSDLRANSTAINVFSACTAVQPSSTTLGRKVALPLFRHSKFIPLLDSDTRGKQQPIYLYEKLNAMGTTGTFNITASASLSDTSIGIIGGSGTSYTGVGLAPFNYQRAAKMSFDTNDQYLLGKRSCGAYLFLSTDKHDSIVVNGKSQTSIKTVNAGTTSSIKVPISFQYRMTDYYGSGTTGIGNIGGDSTGRTVNLKYSKAMGIDIYVKGGDVFSFDVEISAKYSPDNLNLDVIPRVDVTGALYDLQNTIKTIAPSVGGGGGGGCPTPDMRIMTGIGKWIDAGMLKIGDLIYTAHEITNEWGHYAVTHAERMLQPVLEVVIGGKGIKVSDTHRFLTESGAYIKISDLNVGDNIETILGLQPIESITIIGENEIVKLEIDEAHTYVVEGARSHNVKGIYSVDGANWQNSSQFDFIQNMQ